MREDSEKEILIGNKQLVGIFFLIVILIGVAFAAGYKIGAGKKSDSTAQTVDTASIPGAQTHTADTGTQPPPAAETAPSTATEAPLGAPHTEPASAPKETSNVDTEAAAPETPHTAAPRAHEGFVPEAGQTFLQVAATQQTEAEAVADVLRHKGFRAHAVPKPGTKLYRVIIGPTKDAADLNATRARLQKTGFRDIITQRY